jgi:hypothetical protein
VSVFADAGLPWVVTPLKEGEERRNDSSAAGLYAEENEFPEGIYWDKDWDIPIYTPCFQRTREILPSKRQAESIKKLI